MEKDEKKKENIILKKYIPLLKKHFKVHQLTKEQILMKCLKVLKNVTKVTTTEK